MHIQVPLQAISDFVVWRMHPENGRAESIEYDEDTETNSVSSVGILVNPCRRRDVIVL